MGAGSGSASSIEYDAAAFLDEAVLGTTLGMMELGERRPPRRRWWRDRGTGCLHASACRERAGRRALMEGTAQEQSECMMVAQCG